MIKNTFVNLSEEKRERIVNAIIEEFAQHTTDKVSINKIIQRADISRGSFYQYFDDKDDLIEVIAMSFFGNFYNKSNELLEKSDGDVFLIYISIFDLIAGISVNREKKAVVKNLLSGLRANEDIASDYLRNRIKFPVDKDNIYEYVDRSKLAFTSDFDVKCLIGILNQLFKNAIFELFVMEIDCDIIREKFTKKIEIIKAGALK